MIDPEEEDSAVTFRLPDRVDLLEAALTQTQAKLVVIDPIMAFLDKSVMNANDQSIRRALHPLVILAARHKCAILLIRHLNKRGGSQALYRGGGSIGFIGLSRSAWLIAHDPADKRRRVLAQLKNNLAPPQPGLAYSFPADENAPTTIFWLGTSAHTADQLLAAAGSAPPLPTSRERAKDFLKSILEDGPKTSTEIWRLAEEQRLSDTTLNRAKIELKITSKRVYLDHRPISYWLLPGQQLPSSIPPEAVPPDLEEWLAPLANASPQPPRWMIFENDVTT